MTVPYILKRSKKRRRTISLQINNQSDVVVSAPYFTPTSEINLFVRQKFDWIQKNIEKQKVEQIHTKENQYVSGEDFYYLGIPYPLELFYQQNLPAGLVFWSNRFYLNTAENITRKKDYFIQWYRTKAQEHFTKRVNYYSNELGLMPRKIRITAARQRWGSCSEENNVAFSFRLIMALPSVIDYVIIHELMHIKEKNHSAKFWRLVAAVMPEYKTHRHWLRENGHKLIL
jgi:predicted metal-dependent hydrolase